MLVGMHWLRQQALHEGGAVGAAGLVGEGAEEGQQAGLVQRGLQGWGEGCGTETVCLWQGLPSST